MPTRTAEAFGGYFEGYASRACKDYCNALIAEGWRRIGEYSCYGIVFRHPDHPDYVHKVAFRAKEDGWVAFVKYALKNPNPHFPKVRGMVDHGDFVVADIEALKEVGYNGEAYSKATSVKRVTESDGQKFGELLAYLDVKLAEAVVALKDNFLKDWKVDLHPGNFMLRGDTLIINDPLSWRL